MPTVKRHRRTPWDTGSLRTAHCGVPASLGQAMLSERLKQREVGTTVFRLHGLYVFDPSQATSQDVREFMWAGLRFLRVQAHEKGLSDDEIRKMLGSAFDVFHDAAESMWTTIRVAISKKERDGRPCGDAPVVAERFVACDEDRPVPVRMTFDKPLTILDPDAQLLASFEP